MQGMHASMGTSKGTHASTHLTHPYYVLPCSINRSPAIINQQSPSQAYELIVTPGALEQRQKITTS